MTIFYRSFFCILGVQSLTGIKVCYFHCQFANIHINAKLDSLHKSDSLATRDCSTIRIHVKVWLHKTNSVVCVYKAYTIWMEGGAAKAGAEHQGCRGPHRV